MERNGIKYFLDTEFHEHKKKGKFSNKFTGTIEVDTIELISIGIVTSDDREYYAICNEFDVKAAWNNEWLRDNVLKSIFYELLDIDFENLKTGDVIDRWKFTMKDLKRLLNKYGSDKYTIRREILQFVIDPTGELLDAWMDRIGAFYNALMDRDLGKGNYPEFYAYFADYDWVVFCWIFGRMIDLPESFPMFCLDLKQMMYEKGLDGEWKNEHCPTPEGNHNALIDAKWNKQLEAKILTHKDD
jgi:hypothetical protein